MSTSRIKIKINIPLLCGINLSAWPGRGVSGTRTLVITTKPAHKSGFSGTWGRRGGRDSNSIPLRGPAADAKNAPSRTRSSSGGEGGIRTRG